MEVNLTKRIRLPDGTTRFCPVVLAANGRVRPDWVWLDGKQEHHTEGRYYLDWNEGGKRFRRSVGSDASQAAGKRSLQEGIRNAQKSGIQNVPALDSVNGSKGTVLVQAVAVYLEQTRLAKKPKTYAAYKTTLDYFLESCKKQTLEEIQRDDLIKFIAFLRTKKVTQRTVYNKFENLMSFLKARGVRGLVTKEDWPRFTEEEPEIYEREDLDKFFTTCTPEERLWFEFFLMTGMREQEVMHVYWSDVNLKACTVKVTHKPDRSWTPKQYKEREIPIPDMLAKSLKAWKAKSDGTCNLVFPTSGCRPKLDFLDCCKAVATRAKLNPDEFWLHKFRATFATWSLWAGVDLRTVQDWLGHSDMESTMRYLKPSRSQQTRAKVNQIFA